MNFLILFCVLFLVPLWGEDKKPVGKLVRVRVVKILKLPFEKLARKPAKWKGAALPEKEQKNVKQYDFVTYCNYGFMYFSRPGVMVRYYPELFKGVGPDVAAGFVQQKMLHNLSRAECEW